MTSPLATPWGKAAALLGGDFAPVALGIAALSHAEPVAARWWSARGFVPEFVLDGYATLDPSYRLVRRLTVAEPPGASAFYQLLRAHSLVDKRGLSPVPFTFATPSGPAPVRPPHIFLIVIDSLRRDYLSPYNPAVRFTPRIQAFADENLRFANAFTRYGGTGLSMPAMRFSKVLLPDPDGPISAVNSPRWISSVISVSTGTICPPHASVNWLRKG